MMTENLESAALKGRLAEAEHDLDRINIRADSLVTEIRFVMDPQADSVTDIDTEKAVILVEELHKLREKAVSLDRKIRQMGEALNG